MFHDRTHAGIELGKALTPICGKWKNAVVLALPRGGVPVALEVARILNITLDVFIVRKLGVPDRAELAMGAIASGGIRVLNRNVIDALNISEQTLAEVCRKETLELERREREYSSGATIALAGKNVILVDDGLATGATMRAAVEAVKTCRPSELVVAVPVAARETLDLVASQVDLALSVLTPENFDGVGQWYENFDQTSDEEVRQMLLVGRGLPRTTP